MFKRFFLKGHPLAVSTLLALVVTLGHQSLSPFLGGNFLGQAGLANGLLAHYTFDDGTGKDVTNNGFDLQNNGATPLQGCMNFNGINSYLGTTNGTGLPSGNQPRTIGYWINTAVYQDVAIPFSLGITTIYGVNSGEPQRFLIGPAKDVTFSGRAHILSDAVNDGAGANNVEITGTQIPPAGSWHHVLIAYDGNQRWQYYLDGTLAASGTFGVPINTVTNGLEIGGFLHYRHGRQQDWFFRGQMDDVRIYDRVLSVSEISQLSQVRPSCEAGTGSSSSAARSSSSAAASASSGAASSSTSGGSLSSSSRASSQPGSSSVSSLSQCRTVCGDGIKAGAEACDDGNTQSADGCSSACAIESGYQCMAAGNGLPSGGSSAGASSASALANNGCPAGSYCLAMGGVNNTPGLLCAIASLQSCGNGTVPMPTVPARQCSFPDGCSGACYFPCASSSSSGS